MENRRLEEPAVSGVIDKASGFAEDADVTMYGEYKVVSVFSDSGLTLTDALSGYIDRMTSLKY